MISLQDAFTVHQFGRLQEAAGLYRNFIKANPRHAEAHHLLGIACMQMGNTISAIESLSQAIRLDDRNPNYYNNLGLVHFYRDDVETARENYERALALAPNNADTLNNLGMALQRLDDIVGAIARFEEALEINPEEPEILHNYGVALHDAGEPAKAMAALKKAVAANGDNPDTLAALAALQFYFDQYDNAIASCWRAVRIDPLNVDAHKTFKKSTNHDGERYATFRWALEALPQNAKAFEMFGRELIQDKNFIEAEAILRRALSIAPDLTLAQSSLGAALSMLDRHEEALAHHAIAAKLEPNNSDILHSYGQCLIRAGRPDDAVPILKGAHKINPRMSSILGNLTIALVETDNPSVDALIDYDKDIVTRVLAPPPEFSDMAAFNETLHEELEVRHREKLIPTYQTMRGGSQIPGNLFENPSDNVLAIKNLIGDSVRAVIAGLEKNPEHPFLRFVNPDFRFIGAWSTILYGAGYDASHIHNEGWLSGVYYVKVPDLDEDRWASGEGCIQFGAPPDAFVSERNRTRRLIRPQPGLLVLFPSYVWHGVKPFTQEGLRHSIAFDIK